MPGADTTTTNISIAFEHASALLNQQLWCWGQDIESANGNLLLRYGFQRTRLSEETSSIYRLDVSPVCRVILRGFCVFFGHERLGGLLIRRFGFAPCFSHEADVTESTWRSEDLSQFNPPSEDHLANWHCLLLSLVDWIRRYEAWVLECEDTDYREATLMKWNAAVPADAMVSAWRTLGLVVSDASSHALMSACISDDETSDDTIDDAGSRTHV